MAFKTYISMMHCIQLPVKIEFTYFNQMQYLKSCECLVVRKWW